MTGSTARSATKTRRKAAGNGARAQKSAARREAILAAALDEFSAQGFAATRLVDVFVGQIFETRRKDVIRLVITEGPRFPQLAEFYYTEVISRALAIVRGMLRRAFERGELKTDALVRFPQLLVSPGIVSIVWSGLFDRFEPLDVRAMMRAHFDLVLRGGGT